MARGGRDGPQPPRPCLAAAALGRRELSLARQVEQPVVGLEALLFGKGDDLVLGQDLGSDDILAAKLLALDDPVIDRPVSLAQELRGLAGEAGADRGHVLLRQRGTGERPDRGRATGFLTPAGDRLLADA